MNCTLFKGLSTKGGLFAKPSQSVELLWCYRDDETKQVQLNVVEALLPLFIAGSSKAAALDDENYVRFMTTSVVGTGEARAPLSPPPAANSLPNQGLGFRIQSKLNISLRLELPMVSKLIPIHSIFIPGYM